MRDFHTHVSDFDISAYNFHTYACDLHTHACDFDTLRDKLVYYNTNINLSYRQMPAARMRIESKICAAL
jgi:hypothetical protein